MAVTVVLVDDVPELPAVLVTRERRADRVAIGRRLAPVHGRSVPPAASHLLVGGTTTR